MYHPRVWLILCLVTFCIKATAQEPSHWAYESPRDVFVPSDIAANPIDAFVLQRLKKEKISPAPHAAPEVWLRRVTLDLTGLPPTPQELSDFLADSSLRAREKFVDRLLASPRYGERWAQHWLDLAQYADSNGFELDADRPDAWRYRDWVIRALNSDMPYDQFLTWQIAGDEAAPGSIDAAIAGGFGRAGAREEVAGNIDQIQKRQDDLTQLTSSVGSVFMGLTIGCARCHDHKFDPIPTADYYRLQAYFAGVELVNIPIATDQEKSHFETETQRLRKLAEPINSQKGALEKPYRDKLRAAKEANLSAREKEVRAKKKEERTPEEQRMFEGTETALNVPWEELAEAVAENPADHVVREKLKRELHELSLQAPHPLPHVASLQEKTTEIPETWVLGRGQILNRKERVEPNPPSALGRALPQNKLSSATPQRIDPQRSGRRLALAQWMLQPSHPLTARVIVNRLWQHHFGKGLVATPSDFGVRGSPPTHPELLDWLAQELIRQRWHLKSIHRLIVLSDTYARDSQMSHPMAGTDRDPENRLLWRMNRRRLEAEALRDCVLSATGSLNLKMGGPGVRATLEPEVKDLIFTEAEVVDLWPEDRDPTEHHRRSIYLHRKRNVPYPLMSAFDAPDALSPCPERSTSIHAPQALVMLNGQFALQSATAFSQRLLREATATEDRIRNGFLLALSRYPTEEELAASARFITDGLSANPQLGPDEKTLDAWTDFALALLNSSEFAYVR